MSRRGDPAGRPCSDRTGENLEVYLRMGKAEALHPIAEVGLFSLTYLFVTTIFPFPNSIDKRSDQCLKEKN